MSKLKIYKASAGSGKTYTLALEYIKELLLSSSNENYRHILAVTFTKDATGEMKDRILAELYGLAFSTQDSDIFLDSLQTKLVEAGKPLKEEEIRSKSKQVLLRILHDYSRLNITTIDSFFQRVLRNLARELGKGSRFNLEMNTGKVLSEAVRAVIEKASENKQILNWLTTYIETKLDEGKNWRIEEEIYLFSQCIYNEFFQEHEQILRKQLEENPQLFEELNKQQHQIQSKCKAFFKDSFDKVTGMLNENQLELSDFGSSKAAINLFNKLEKGDYDPTIGSVIQKCMLDSNAWGAAKSPRKNEIIALAESKFIPLMEQTFETLTLFKTSRMITRNLHQLGLIWDITNEISEQNTANNRFMLSDTALFLNRIIDNSDAPFIYEKLGAEIRHVMIDEFQDTSRLQWSNFKVLLSNILANNDFSLIVGDVKQSIYRWRNGDWRILNNIGAELNAKPETLGSNFRSEKQIIDFNNHFFTHAAHLLNQLYREKFGDISQSPFLSTYNPEDVEQKTNKKTDKGFVSIDFVPGKNEEEDYKDLMKKAVLEKLQQLSEAGIPANKICMLTRNNKEVVVLAEYLSSLKEEHPLLAEKHYLDLISNEAFQLNSSLAIKIIIEALRCIVEPDNPVCKAQLDYFRPSSSQLLFPALQTMPLFELVGYLYRLLELNQISGQSAYLFTFYDAISSYLNEKSSDINNFLSYWNDELNRKSVASGTGINGIRAMTIHKSKGLQFHTVIVPFCDWELNPRAGTTIWCGAKEGLYDLELLPVSYNKGMDKTIFSGEYEEETTQTWMDNLNVLYVAFTRAENNLIILAKDNEKLEEISKIITVSDLLQFNITELNNTLTRQTFDTTSKNEPTSSPETKVNLLKQTPRSYPVSFVSEDFKQGQSIFKQSNQSKEFIDPSRKNEYITYGNVMHKLFEQINTWEEISTAIENHISEGFIHPNEKQFYQDKIQSAILESDVKDWFSDKYTNYRESTILMEENGELKQKRPDKVLVSNDSTIVIDFKFGQAHAAHKKQVRQYMELLKEMNYPHVEGYLWYVEDRKVEPIIEL